VEPDIIPYGDTSQPIKLFFSIFFREEEFFKDSWCAFCAHRKKQFSCSEK